ncbi:MAG: peptidylprolyl isomerase [Deltaproteobacteria bacterium]|nr:peptidylprolyl isomerase [Deltaproteobacteria bacterium]
MAFAQTSKKLPTGGPTVEIETRLGKITCHLFPKQAPKTVENFIGLATGKKEWTDPRTQKPVKGKSLYEGTLFHRVIRDFMIQGGDPLGTGTGGPGYRFEDEFSPDLTFDRPGLLAMANSGPGTNGSQFFITVKATPWLNNRHTIFGDCTDPASQATTDKISVEPTAPGDRPLEPVIINKIRVIEPKKEKK